MTSDMGEEVNILSIYQLPSSNRLGVRGDILHLTCDTWHMTCDMWHMSYVMCHVTRRGWWTLCPTQLINNKGACRTAPTTLGLLKRERIKFNHNFNWGNISLSGKVAIQDFYVSSCHSECSAKQSSEVYSTLYQSVRLLGPAAHLPNIPTTRLSTRPIQKISLYFLVQDFWQFS